MGFEKKKKNNTKNLDEERVVVEVRCCTNLELFNTKRRNIFVDRVGEEGVFWVYLFVGLTRTIDGLFQVAPLVFEIHRRAIAKVVRGQDFGPLAFAIFQHTTGQWD